MPSSLFISFSVISEEANHLHAATRTLTPETTHTDFTDSDERKTPVVTTVLCGGVIITNLKGRFTQITSK